MSRSQVIPAINPGILRDLLSRAPGGETSTGARVVSGSIIMLAGSALVSGFNFFFNVAMARMLGPARFSQVTAAATILMLFSAVTLSFQLVCAKFIARNTTAYGRRRIYEKLIRRSWMFGISLSIVLILFSRQFADYLQIRDNKLLIVLALAIAFYVPLGVRRGWMQGLCEFPKLTWNFLLEAALKLGFALLLVYIGYGVFGAVGALSASVLGAYLFTVRNKPHKNEAQDAAARFEPASFREGMQAIVFFVGQVVINNIDILMVKHFFPPAEAGIYAAVALVGRVLYFFCWSVVSAMFPISAGAEKEESAWQVLRWPLLVVGAMSGIAVAVMAAFPEPIMQLLFGANFHQSGHLLALYAALTGIYALAVTLIAFEMSRKIANTGWLQLLFSGMVVLGIALFHSTLRDVAMVQLVLMLLLLALVSLPFVIGHRRRRAGAGKMEEPA
ncbi:MAG: oligosaccharide flippase family protein [Acidobacteriaceae bacterium]